MAYPTRFVRLSLGCNEHLKELGEHIEQYDHLLNEHFKQCELSQRIASLPGCRTYQCHCNCRHDWGCLRVQEWTSAIRVVGAGTSTTF